jgi:hypothetical protein
MVASMLLYPGPAPVLSAYMEEASFPSLLLLPWRSLD